MNDYIKLYADTFNLRLVNTIHQIILFEANDIVGYVSKSNPKYFNYKYSKTWSACKASDLAVAVLNNIPAHG